MTDVNMDESVSSRFNFSAASKGEIDESLALSQEELNSADYLADLSDYEMTEANKLKLLETLWSIALTFVRLGFTSDNCEQILKELITEERSDVRSDILSEEPINTVDRRNSRGETPTP